MHVLVCTQIINGRKPEAQSVEGGSSPFATNRIDFGPTAHLKHTSKSQSLISDTGIDGFATQRNVGDSLQVFTSKTSTTISNIQTTMALGNV